MTDLVSRFLPRFAALARERAARAVAVASAADAAQAQAVVRDMHSVAGEAGMLGLTDVLQAARRVERTAREFSTDVGLAGALADALRELELALAAATRGLP